MVSTSNEIYDSRRSKESLGRVHFALQIDLQNSIFFSPQLLEQPIVMHRCLAVHLHWLKIQKALIIPYSCKTYNILINLLTIYIAYRISANSFRRKYSFLNLTLWAVTFEYSTYRCRKYSREETIQGRKLFAEIW